MVGIIQRVSSNRIIEDGAVISANNGSLGGIVFINSASSFSIVPGVNVTGLKRYYNIYVITTNSAITLSLPSASTNVTIGWKCKIVLSSTAGTGVLTIINSSLVSESIITANMANFTGCVELVLLNTVSSMWSTMFRTFKGPAIANNITYKTTRTLTTVKPIQGIFFAYSGTVAVNLNTTTVTLIPWEFGYAGRFVDTTIFDPAPSSNVRIVPLRSCSVIIRCCIYFGTAGGASATGFNCNLYVNGVAGSTAGGIVRYPDVSKSSNGMIEYTISTTLTAGIFYQIGANRTATTAGTNTTVPADTYIHIQVINYL